MNEGVNGESATPKSRKARVERVIANLPPEEFGRRFDLLDFREPSAKALEFAKRLEGRARRHLGRKRAA